MFLITCDFWRILLSVFVEQLLHVNAGTSNIDVLRKGGNKYYDVEYCLIEYKGNTTFSD